jgi:hypothetical protein
MCVYVEEYYADTKLTSLATKNPFEAVKGELRK